MRIAFTTLGCKINQFETDVMQRDFVSQGNTLVPFDAEADIYVINTCSVTAKSDIECRRIIRSTIRRNKGAKVVVTGCYAETRPDELRSIPGVELIFGNKDKKDIPSRIQAMNSSSGKTGSPEANTTSPSLHSRTRGFLKIQDGCDNCCSYCIVPLARGRARSALPSDVQREFLELVEKGCPEIVLTGIHIGAYGSDRTDGVNLTELLKTLVPLRRTARIRLSSIEPKEITRELMDFLGQGLCRHLHIPLQSGSDAMLSSMRRDYTSHEYRELLDTIATRTPGMALGADIIVGFPGEGEKEFQSTMKLVEEAPLSHLHVFIYSPRPGTSAADMSNQVPEHVKKQRSYELRFLGMKKNLLFRMNHLNSELKAVVENKKDPDTGLFVGVTDNYIRLQIRGAKQEHIGKEISVRLNEVKEQVNTGVIL